MDCFLLINSPINWEPVAENEQYLSPFGLGYIATYLDKNGIKVELLDCVKEQLVVLDIIRKIESYGATYVGINVFSQNYRIVKHIVESIKTDCIFFIGGQSVKALYTDILNWSTRNRLNIIIGDGEFIIPKIVMGECVQKPEYEQGTKQVYVVNADSPYFPKDISSLDLNRKFLGREIITNHYGEEEASIVTSRGCAYDCAFCGGARSLNKEIPIRIRSEESIKKELDNIVALYPHIQSIRILDDLFLRNRQSIIRANNIFSQYPTLSWRGMAHVRPLMEAYDYIKDLKIGKCHELFIGIESGSQRIREQINKLGNTDDILHVSCEILRCGIDLKGYFIYGFPGETKDDFQKTYDLAASIREKSQYFLGSFRTSVFQFRPYHGTKLYQEIIQTTGLLHECEYTEELAQAGKSQFNFNLGNYSAEPTEVLFEYIQKTRSLGEKSK